MTFTDVSIDHWALPTIRRGVFYGIINGYPDGTFRPDAQVSRAEAVTMAVRVMDRSLILSSVAIGVAIYAIAQR